MVARAYVPLNPRTLGMQKTSDSPTPWKIRPATKQDVPSIVWLTQVGVEVCMLVSVARLPGTV